jgi:hypothetical protein
LSRPFHDHQLSETMTATKRAVHVDQQIVAALALLQLWHAPARKNTPMSSVQYLGSAPKPLVPISAMPR